MSSDVIANQPPQNPVNSPAVPGGVANPIGGRGGGTPPSIEKIKQRMIGYRERQRISESQYQNTRDTNDIQNREDTKKLMKRYVDSSKSKKSQQIYQDQQQYEASNGYQWSQKAATLHGHRGGRQADEHRYHCHKH